ncbi:TonB-dependent receptor [Oleiharenicola lentus]|jgi:TonB-dependent receptor|uniref:TonB-dependent receptor n=1 Tax=Oleiharenicola lentus TaxID=2508720 RepID=A0A4Q1C5C4_9BACT|nr:TonB-dependent receptor [Oleiharenicola lentus]RXK53601.1 TonB-dependent receptor [Oleiharenicola lentus]
MNHPTVSRSFATAVPSRQDSSCRLSSRPSRLLLCVLAAALVPASALAAVISGTVNNKNTQKYLDRAVVEVVGTGLKTLTTPDGRFSLSGVPAGTHTVTATYTGLDPKSQTITVTEEQAAAVSFELTSDIYELDALVVTSTIEGTAAAINQQRRSESALSVSTMDAFVDQSTGNPGEFLRNISGIQMDYSQNEPNRIRIRGQDPVLTSVTMDGNEIASAASSGTTRNLEVDQLSMAAIESVEVFKAPIPSMSANAIGGAVNFVTKSAFDQKGRRASLQLGVLTDSHDFFGRYIGPGHNDSGRKVSAYPIGRLTYSNSFFNNRLGVVASVGRDESFMLGSSTTHTFNVYNAPAGTGEITPANATIFRNQLLINPNRQLRTRSDYSLNLDFRLNDEITLFLKNTFTRYHSTNRNHSFNLTPTNSLTAYTPDSTLEKYTTTNGRADQGVSVFSKYTDSWQINPGLKFKSGLWQAELVGGLSKSINHYRNDDNFGSLSIFTATGNGWTVTTPRDNETPTAFVQNSGPSVYDLYNYFPNQANLASTNGEHRANHGGMVTSNIRNSSEVRWSGRLDVQRDFQLSFPFYLKAGLAYNETIRDRYNTPKRWYWVGDDGVAGTADDLTTAAQLGRFAERVPVTQGLPDFHIREANYFSTTELFQYWQKNPKVLVENKAYALDQWFQNRRKVNEKITGYYLMGSGNPIPKLNVLAGLRIEETDVAATGIRTLPTSGATSVLPVGVDANSVAGINAKYRFITSTSKYRSDPFPYLHLRYEVLPNLQARASYTEAIGRPDFAQILPSLTQNDTPTSGFAGTITSTRAGLLPQRSQNFDFSLEYYTKTAGEWTFAWFRRDIDDYIASATVPMTSELLAELGLGSEFANYQLATSDNLGNANWDGYELSVRQRLSDWEFMPGFLRGFEIWANHTRIYSMEGTFTGGTTGATITHLANVVDSQFNAGVSYRSPRGRLYVHLKTNFQAGRPTANILATGPSNRANPRLEDYQFWDGELTYALKPNLRLTVTARNLLAERQKNTEYGLVRARQQDTGISWIFGAKYDL